MSMIQNNDTQCYSRYGEYDNMNSAKLACYWDDNCAGIHDDSCDGKKLQLCKIDAHEIKSSTGSCVYKVRGTIT